MDTDYRGWHRVARFVSDHQQECGRPTYACALVVYSKGLADFLCTRAGRALFWLAPGLFGVRVTLCTTCFTSTAQSWIGDRILWLMGWLKDDDKYEILLFSEDVERMPKAQRDKIEFEIKTPEEKG